MFELWCEWGVSESSPGDGLVVCVGDWCFGNDRGIHYYTTVLVRSCLSAGVDNIFLKHFDSKPGL